MIAVTTCFPNDAWDVYAKAMLLSFVKYWPKDIPLLVNLNDDLLFEDCKKILRPNDGVCCGWDKDHIDFVERNKGKDSTTDYRKQAVRFCHKVFAIKHVLTSIEEAKKENVSDVPRYLVWMDADVITTAPVTHEALKDCLPKDGDAVAYLGRKDWDHSECGWLAFDLEKGGEIIINKMINEYINDDVFKHEQWHDSWIFDHCHSEKKTNLTEGKPGREIWQHSPMASFSVHHKGPVAKEVMQGLKQPKNVPLRIETKNSIPDENIKRHIQINQLQIKNWLSTCKENDEEIIVVSAGPMLQLDEVMKEYNAGKKIVAVKHALKRLKEIGITPWACILLDPRPHVNKFVESPDKNIIWLVASQVAPEAVCTLLDAGCNVWGYHAAVGADETVLTEKQPDSIVTGGSATATRGLFVLDKLGFRKFKLYGYDLCLTEKPDLKEKDQLGQPKYYEITIASNHNYNQSKRTFWSTAEFVAQYQEMNEMIARKIWDIQAFGHGIIPFMTEAKTIGDLREQQRKGKITPLPSYRNLLCKKNSLWATWRKPWPLTLLRRRADSNS